MQDTLNLDYETRSRIDLKARGLDIYSNDMSTRVMMAAWSLNRGRVKHWQRSDGPFPTELRQALQSPDVIKKGFNAQFERIISDRVLGLNTGYKNWRCTMVLAYLQSFTGSLGEIARQIGIPDDKAKDAEGKKLIQVFCKPQKISKAQPHLWRDEHTDPDLWQHLCEYNVQDVVAEMAIEDVLSSNYIDPTEWDLYELDQLINDRGLPIDMGFVRNAIQMAARRKKELTDELRELTGLANPNSPMQLQAWLIERGYPFKDLRKDTVKKVVANFSSDVTPEAMKAMELRLIASKTADRKYTALNACVGHDDRFRFGYQFAGASRTLRFAGRRVQTHNLARTPKFLEPTKTLGDQKLVAVTKAIRAGDYDHLCVLVKEPMEALAGCVRSAICAPKDYIIRACDLKSIETVVIAFVSGCEALLNVFREGRCAYREFATEMYKVMYDEVESWMRTNAKPAVLGCGYRLGGGELREGKRTGLWGYAEAMGINMEVEESHKSVAVYRKKYHEVPKLWKDLENAIEWTLKTGRRTRVGILKFEKRGKYLIIWLPSGRPMYYYMPQMRKKTFLGKKTEDFPKGEPFTRNCFTYMGKNDKNVWTRIFSHGGKIVENVVQAMARDILKLGLLEAHRVGFNIIGHVHDEIKTLQKKTDKILTHERLREAMIVLHKWFKGMPLDAAGGEFEFYRKD